MVAHEDGFVGISAYAVLVDDGVLIGVHDEDVPTQQAVISERNLVCADNGAFSGHVEICTERKIASHREFGTVSDAGFASKSDGSAHLPDAAGAFAVIMAHIAEPDFDHGRVHLFRQHDFAVQFAKKSAM